MNNNNHDCQEVREWIASGGEHRDNSLETRRYEVHLEDCSACLDWLSADREVVDRAMEELTGPPLTSFEAVSSQEWRTIDLALEKQGALVGTRRSGWRAFVPLAAAIFLCFLVIQAISEQGFQGPAEENDLTAEILDLPPGSQSFILTPEEEDGGVIIFVTSG